MGVDTAAPVMATVCASWPRFVQVTGTPVLTVMTAGLNAKLAMSTDAVATGAAWGPAVAVATAAGEDRAAAGVAALAAGWAPPHAARASPARPLATTAAARGQIGVIFTSSAMPGPAARLSLTNYGGGYERARPGPPPGNYLARTSTTPSRTRVRSVGSGGGACESSW